MLGETNERNCNGFFMSMKYSNELPFLCHYRIFGTTRRSGLSGL